MSAFDDLKKQAEVKVKEDEAAMLGWVNASKAWLIACAACLAIGFILAKVLG